MSEESWEKVQSSLRKNLSKPSYETWIRPTEFSEFKNGELILIAPNSFSGAWLKNNYSQTIKETAEQVFGQPVKVTVTVKDSTDGNLKLPLSEPVQSPALSSSISVQALSETVNLPKKSKSLLNLR